MGTRLLSATQTNKRYYKQRTASIATIFNFPIQWPRTQFACQRQEGNSRGGIRIVHDSYSVDGVAIVLSTEFAYPINNFV